MITYFFTASSTAVFTTTVLAPVPKLKLPREPTALPTRFRRGRWQGRAGWSAVVLLAALFSLAAYYSVDPTLTADDRQYIQLLLPGVAEGSARQAPYRAQIALVQRCQRAVEARAPSFLGIPEGLAREPKQLYLRRQGMCYDRSRVLEKMFSYLGLETRHVSLFQPEPNVNALRTLLFHHVPSHAISEVLTAQGWLMVDSNTAWLSLDRQYKPISVHQMADHYRHGKPLRWLMPVPPDDVLFYGPSSCIYIYGLYSRHGRFYPPYTSYIPDYRGRELLYNLE